MDTTRLKNERRKLKIQLAAIRNTVTNDDLVKMARLAEVERLLGNDKNTPLWNRIQIPHDVYASVRPCP